MRDVVAGLALGAFVGLVVGLSTSEVVGTLVGALVAVLASFLGLQGNTGSLPTANTLRLIGFSASAVAGLLLGIFLRANDGLAPSPVDRSAAWKEVGFSDEAAAELVAFERLGLVRGEWRALEGSRPNITGLFAGEDADACDTLTGRRYPSSEAYDDALNAEGGSWQRFADAVPSELSAENRVLIFEAAIQLVCIRSK